MRPGSFTGDPYGGAVSGRQPAIGSHGQLQLNQGPGSGMAQHMTMGGRLGAARIVEPLDSQARPFQGLVPLALNPGIGILHGVDHPRDARFNDGFAARRGFSMMGAGL